MIGLRRTWNGLWVNGATLPYSQIAAMKGSCQVNGGKLVFGPIGSGPMWGAWCCGSWGCTEAWRPDRERGGGMGAPMAPPAAPAAPVALGQQVPFADAITQIAKALNTPPCISSKQYLPIIDKALAFGSEQTPYPFSFYRLMPGDSITIGRSDMQRAAATLNWWRNRVSYEPDTQYCKGYNDVGGKRTNTSDRWQLQQAIIGPYQAASGIVGATGVLDGAAADLLSAVTLGISSGEPPWYLQIKYLAPIAIAAMALGLFSRIKGSKPAAAPPPRREEPIDVSATVSAPPPEPAPAPPPPRQSAPISTTRTSPSRASRVSRPSGTTSALRRPRPASTSASRTSARPRKAPDVHAARDWSEYKRWLRSGEPRDGRRHSREVA